ncbi:MAG: hypothetical protein NZM09_11225 [Ignavibacterium sp.]|nr:hypothetical protein [Ignavibacterium sp.]MCX7611186.1 hypothetical protein [Ignavibacterium sp.]MDW8376248.1 hypothetical protein [Ignavibacteriales bacterium]
MKKVFFLFLLFIVSCSKNYNEEIKKAEDLISKNKYKEAVEVLKKVSDADDEKFSPVALSILGRIYQQHNLTDIQFKESQKIAQKYYYQIFEEYPKSNLAPKGLFMSAFILANELNEFEQAKKQYQLFLEKFPNDELAPSAKVELENVGLPPEMILNKRLNSSNEN